MPELTNIIAALRDEFVELSDTTWHDPELRWAEFRAVERQKAIARAHGFVIEDNVAGLPTAFTASRGTGGDVLAVLGEYDSLSRLSQESGVATHSPLPGGGNAHGCGHNLLGAGSLLAAVAAAEYLDAAGIPGTVRYFGCPAEEAAAGKTFMVRDGAFDGVDAAITWHPATVLSARQYLTLAYTQVHFDFDGVAAHAGASPHLGRSALDAVELLNVGVNFLREHMLDSARVHYAITDAGGDSPNVVQSFASVYYIVRSKTVADMRELYARVIKIAQGAALMTETTLTVRFEGASAELLPNDALEEVLSSVADAAGPVPFTERHHAEAAPFAPQGAPALLGSVIPMDPRAPRMQTTASTDVGDVSWVVPTAQVMAPTAANGTPIHSWQMVAQGAMPHAHEAMIHAARVMAQTLIELASRPELVSHARAEHAAAVALTPYENPIPAEIVAPPRQP